MLRGGRVLPVGGRTLVAGTLNVTPDSFYDGGRYFGSIEKAVARVREHVEEGADIVDIGGESTRPGSEPVSAEEELRRVIPVIQAVREQIGSDVIVSIDTYKSGVARQALEAGADMINSVGGMTFDPEIAAVAGEYGCPLAVYHIRGNPRNMQEGEIVYRDVIADIGEFFEAQIQMGLARGMRREQFVIDPGIGFGKTVRHNLEIIRRLGEFKKIGRPILIGVSRKSHLGVILKDALGLAEPPPAEERLEASLAETAVAVLNGADFVRTHDVKEIRSFLAVIDALART